MYDHIINAIKIKHDLNSEQLLHPYLQSLQEPVKSLRNAYRNYPVSFDYSKEENQAAYFITYFPHYTELVKYVLVNQCHNIKTHTFERHDLWLFGSGSCPELVGYLRFLQEKKTSLSKLKIYNIDIAVDTWAYSRDMNLIHIVPQFTGQNSIESFVNKKFDITNLWKVTMHGIPTITVFQNCFNEPATTKHANLIENIKALYTALPDKSTIIIIIIIDLAEYATVKELMLKIENELCTFSDCKIIRSINDGDIEMRSTFANPPQLITSNLLTGIAYNVANGLIPRTTIKFTYSMVYKEKPII